MACAGIAGTGLSTSREFMLGRADNIRTGRSSGLIMALSFLQEHEDDLDTYRLVVRMTARKLELMPDMDPLTKSIDTNSTGTGWPSSDEQF